MPYKKRLMHSFSAHESHSYSYPGLTTVLTEKHHAKRSARNYSLKRTHYSTADQKIKWHFYYFAIS